jgi:hypothetical protein
MEKSKKSNPYEVTFINYEEKDGHIEYLVKINAPGDQIFQFRDRYSNMLAF